MQIRQNDSEEAGMPPRPPGRTHIARRIGKWTAIGCGAAIALPILAVVVLNAVFLGYLILTGDGNVHGPLEPGSRLTVDEPAEITVLILEIAPDSVGPRGYAGPPERTTVWAVLVRAKNLEGGPVYIDFPRLRLDNESRALRIQTDDPGAAEFEGIRSRGEALVEGWIYFEIPAGRSVDELTFYGDDHDPDIVFDAK
jgi:hypothetical protein